MFEQYEHYGKTVWVRSDLKGKHRQECLCYSCLAFHPGEARNCFIAEKIYSLCKEHNLVLPVWECPVFVELK